MARSALRFLIPVTLLCALGIGSWYVEAQRTRTRSALSGFFESQPSELASRVGGRTARILVREGDSVRVGQALIVFEDRAAQAETEAKRHLTEQARQQWRELRNGSRPEDIRRQEAVVAEQSANLAHLRNGPLPEEIAAARDRLRETEAVYRRVRSGPRPQEIEQARAAERNAWARLAQVQRGPTAEEKAEAKARLDAAVAQETLDRSDLARSQSLYDQDAISRQQLERAQANERTSQAHRLEMERAYQRAELGGPHEETEQARAAYEQAKAALALLLAGSRKEDIEAASDDVSTAQENLRLLLRGTRPEDIRAAEARLAQAQAALDLLRAGSRQEQIAQSHAAERAAAATARSSQDNLEERTVRAPCNGVVERILIAVGDLVSPGAPVLRITDPSDLWIRIYVPENNLSRFSVGSDAELQLDGVPEPVLAYVESIATRGEFTPANLQTPDERGRQVFGVRLRLRRPDPRVKAGMYATVKRLGRWP